MIESFKVEEIQPDGTKKEVKVDPATGYHNYLVMFNAIIDLDYAILRMIKSEYNNPKYIKQDVMNVPTKVIKTILLNREDPNPVTVCIDNKELADNIYKEIMTTRYSDLIALDKYMDVTGVFFLMSVYMNMDNVYATVLCTSKEEENVIKKYHPKMNTIVLENPSELDLDRYTEFIFKNSKDVYKFKNTFKEKRVLFLNYRFNVTLDDGPYPDAEVSYYLWETGLSRTAIIDTYRKTDEDYANLKFVIKKKPENN